MVGAADGAQNTDIDGWEERGPVAFERPSSATMIRHQEKPAKNDANSSSTRTIASVHASKKGSVVRALAKRYTRAEDRLLVYSLTNLETRAALY